MLDVLAEHSRRRNTGGPYVSLAMPRDLAKAHAKWTAPWSLLSLAAVSPPIDSEWNSVCLYDKLTTPRIAGQQKGVADSSIECRSDSRVFL